MDGRLIRRPRLRVIAADKGSQASRASMKCIVILPLFYEFAKASSSDTHETTENKVRETRRSFWTRSVIGGFRKDAIHGRNSRRKYANRDIKSSKYGRFITELSCVLGGKGLATGGLLSRGSQVRDLPGAPFPRKFASLIFVFTVGEWLAKKVTAEEKANDRLISSSTSALTP